MKNLCVMCVIFVSIVGKVYALGLKTVFCEDDNYKITVSSACPLPTGIDSDRDKKFYTKKSQVVVFDKKKSKEVFNKKLNCYGVLAEDLYFYMTWFMDGESFDSSNYSFTVKTYDINIHARSFNEITYVQHRRWKGDPIIPDVTELDLRHDIGDQSSSARCHDFPR